MKRAFITHAILIAAAVLLPRFAYSNQALPPWVDDNRREAMFPSAEWYVGFSVGDVRAPATLADVTRRVENEARGRLAERLVVRIQTEGTTGTTSQRTTDAQGRSTETLQRDYSQIIQASTDAEVGRVELSTFHDQSSNRVFALARVKKSDLAGYYVSRIEFYLHLADNDVNLARQFMSTDRRRSAQEKLAEAKNNIEESAKYNEMLSIVDFTGDVRRLNERSARLRTAIVEIENEIRESAPIFITGTETMLGNSASVIIPALQHRFTENGCRVTSDRASAGHILTINAQSCQTSTSGRFSFCYACVNADLTNASTGRSEAKINFTGPKEGWNDMDRACRQAFTKSVDTMWEEIRKSTEICR